MSDATLVIERTKGLEGRFNFVFRRTIFWTWAIIAFCALLLSILALPFLFAALIGIVVSIPFAAGMALLAYLPCMFVWKGSLRLCAKFDLLDTTVLSVSGGLMGFVGSLVLSGLFWLVENDTSGLIIIPLAVVVGAIVSAATGPFREGAQ